jgi:hypothetical protein
VAVLVAVAVGVTVAVAVAAISVPPAMGDPEGTAVGEGAGSSPMHAAFAKPIAKATMPARSAAVKSYGSCRKLDDLLRRTRTNSQRCATHNNSIPGKTLQYVN